MEDKAKNEILGAINDFSTAVDKRFADIESRMATKEDIKNMSTKQDLNIMQGKILDGVDRKIGDMKGDLVVMMRGEDEKVTELITVLKNKQVLSTEEAERLLAINPFPQQV